MQSLVVQATVFPFTPPFIRMSVKDFDNEINPSVLPKAPQISNSVHSRHSHEAVLKAIIQFAVEIYNSANAA